MNKIILLFGAITADFLSAFVFTYLWQWFVMPIFNVPPITLLEALGLWILISLVSKPKNKDIKADLEMLKDTTKTVTYSLQIATRPIIGMALGYLVYLFM